MLIHLENSAGVSLHEVASSLLLTINFCFLHSVSKLEHWQRCGGEYLTCVGVTRHRDMRGSLVPFHPSFKFIVLGGTTCFSTPPPLQRIDEVVMVVMVVVAASSVMDALNWWMIRMPIEELPLPLLSMLQENSCLVHRYDLHTSANGWTELCERGHVAVVAAAFLEALAWHLLLLFLWKA